MTARSTPPPRRSIRSRLGIMAAATVAAVVLAEGVLRVAGYDRHFVNGIASFHQYDPEIGLRGKPGFTGRFHQAEFDVVVSLDELGFRRVRIDSREAPRQSRPRLFAFGDSFTWGWGVDQGEPFVDRLADEIDGLEFHNCGLSGSGQVIQYQLFSRHVKPRLRSGDIVLLQCYENDLIDNVGDHMTDWVRARLVDGGVQLVEPPGPSLSWQLKNAVKEHSYLGNLVAFVADYQKVARRAAAAERSARERFTSGQGTPADEATVDDSLDLPDESPEVVVLAHYFELFARDCADSGAKLAIVVVPGRTLLGENVTDDGSDVYQAARHRAIVRTARASRVPTLDLRPALLREKQALAVERLTFHYDFHWNPDGHRAAANVIAPFLRTILDDE